MWGLRVEPMPEYTVTEEKNGGICFHDTYPYTCPTRRAVLHFDEKGQRWFACPQDFCSVECAKKHLMEENLHEQASLMLAFSKKFYGFTQNKIIPAPSRKQLHPYLDKARGGMMIEEFRTQASKEMIHSVSYPPYFVAPLLQWERSVSFKSRDWVKRPEGDSYETIITRMESKRRKREGIKEDTDELTQDIDKLTSLAST